MADANDGAGPSSPSNSPAAARGWHHRGYLPHFDADRLTQLVTYRLADALPVDVVAKLRFDADKLDRDSSDEAGREAFRQRVDQFLDAGHGACWLRQPDVARIVLDAWQHLDGQRYELLAWVIMPNHVHVLVRLAASTSLSGVIQGWKSFTSRQINRLVGRSGTLWQADYWDTFIRDALHYDNAVRYIRENPVKAGLAGRPEEWVWSSVAEHGIERR